MNTHTHSKFSGDDYKRDHPMFYAVSVGFDDSIQLIISFTFYSHRPTNSRRGLTRRGKVTDSDRCIVVKKSRRFTRVVVCLGESGRKYAYRCPAVG